MTKSPLPPLTKAERAALLYVAGLRDLPGTQKRISGTSWQALSLRGYTMTGPDGRPMISDAGLAEARRV